MADSPLPDVPDTLFDAFAPISDEEWRSAIRSDLRGTDPDALLTWASIDGIDLQAYYRADDRDALTYRSAVPIVRSTTPPANGWRTRVDITSPDLDEARRHLRDALGADVTDIGLHLRVADRALRGLPIHRSGDLNTLLQDTDLTETAIHCTGGSAALALRAMLRVVAAERGVEASALQGSTDFDPMAALARHQVGTADRAFHLAATLARSAEDTPEARLISVDMQPYHDAGASAVQELGLSLGALSETLVQLRNRDVPPAEVMRTLQWIVPVDTSYFMGIAKLRALRLLIPQVLRAFDVDADPAAPFIQAVTSRRSETRYGPYINLLRGTTQATSAVIGGCDVLTVRPFTAPSAPPSDGAMRLARNTQHILRAESHLDHVADPAAGAYYIEVMTDRLARNAWSLFQDIEADGGLLDTLRDGTVQRRIAEVRTERIRRVANREHVLVGTNHYPDLDEPRPFDEHSYPTSTPLQRSGASVAIPDGAAWPSIQRALSDGATLGDVLDALTGDDAPSFDALPSIRLAEPFEALRHRTEQWADRHDGPPRAVLLSMGDPAARSTRASFARNALGVAGFAIDAPLSFDTPEGAAREAADAGADLVVLCSDDDAYSTLAPALCSALDDTGTDPIVLVAGHLPEQSDDLEAAGVDGFIHSDAPLLDLLTDLQQRLGILSETRRRRDDEP
jgi:methylmalonyl-CoA mutase